MRLTLVTPPESEPLTVAEVGEHLRVTHPNAEQAALQLAIKLAREEAESILGRALIEQTWMLSLDAFPACGEIELPKPPLISIESVTYTDVDGASQTLASSAYEVDLSGEKGRLYLAWDAAWPSVRIERNAVNVTFKAGYGDEASDVPAKFRAWMLTRVGDHYAHRERTVTGMTATPLDFVDSLLEAERVLF